MIVALFLLLFVFLVVILLIAAFIFPPTKWLEWVYSATKNKKQE